MNMTTEMSEQINELMSALAKAQGQMSGALKDSDNPFFRSKYADLNSVWNACREALSANGLAVVQAPKYDVEKGTYLLTILGHSSGQWISSSLPINIQTAKEGRVNELQLLGSAITYLRRYALSAIVGVAPDEDDDGNGAVGYKAPPSKSYSKNEKESLRKEEKNITDIQAKELQMILDECDPGYVKSFFNHAKKQHNADNLTQMPGHLYERIKKAAIENRDAYFKKQSEQYNNQELAEEVQ